ncbi:hypothetical protein CPB85DRAFT_1331251 [Mucidula mucida]|nr:hypothetical protein CPB85DRAFT_1331251 [Mucidula mucida]
MSQPTDNKNATAVIVTDDPEFNAADGDICIISSDNVRFKVHSTNLRAHSSVFPVDAANGAEDPAHMAERAEVLRIEVAMAADKYQFLVLSALCDCYMESHATAHPAEVLRYAFLRGEDSILDRVAPHTISLEVLDTAQMFNLNLFQRWILYREACIAFIGALIPIGGETFKQVESRLKEWASRHSTPVPPKFSLSFSPEAWAYAWGTSVKGKVAVHLRK